LLALGLTLRSRLRTFLRVIHRLGGGWRVCRQRRGRVFAGQTLFFGLRVEGGGFVRAYFFHIRMTPYTHLRIIILQLGVKPSIPSTKGRKRASDLRKLGWRVY